MRLYRAAADCHMYQPKRPVRSASRDFGLLTSIPAVRSGLVPLLLRPFRLTSSFRSHIASFFTARFPGLGKRSFFQKCPSGFFRFFFRNHAESRQRTVSQKFRERKRSLVKSRSNTLLSHRKFNFNKTHVCMIARVSEFQNKTNVLKIFPVVHVIM